MKTEAEGGRLKVHGFPYVYKMRHIYSNNAQIQPSAAILDVFFCALGCVIATVVAAVRSAPKGAAAPPSPYEGEAESER